MQHAIREIKNLIQYHENEMNGWVGFFNSDKFKENSIPDEKQQQFAIEFVKKTYGELIDELNKAISILEKSL